MVNATHVIEAARGGHLLDCAVNGEPGPIDADLLRSLFRERHAIVDDRGLRLSNAAITGPLDLTGVTVPFPIHFQRCRIDQPLQLAGANLQELVLTRCTLPAVLANGIEVRRDLNLSGSVISGSQMTTASESRAAAVWLCESRIGGRLLCVDTTIRPAGGRAMQADRMRVAGNVRLIHDFVADGEVRLLGAMIDGSLDLTGAHLGDGTGLALDLADAAIGGSVYLIADRTGRRADIHGRIDLGSARISGQFIIRNATVTAGATPPQDGYTNTRAHGAAISASRLSVGGEMDIDGDTTIDGRMDLPLAELGSLSAGPGCRFIAPGSDALDLTNTTLRSRLELAPSVAIRGTLRLTGAAIHGNLTLSGVRLTDPGGRSSVAAQAVTVDGDVQLLALEVAAGKVNFRGATIGGMLDAQGAHLNNPDAYTISLHQAAVRGSVRLVDGFRSTGAVLLNRVSIDGRLDCRGGIFVCPALTPENPAGTALEAFSATMRGGMYLGWQEIHPAINLTATTTSTLADDPAAWPASYIITGLTYERFENLDLHRPDNAWNGPARRAWLAGQTPFDSGPYEQAARVFRQHGYVREAEDVLIAQRRIAAKTAIRRPGTGPLLATFTGLRSALFGATVGYGYRPGRVLWLMTALLLAVLLTVVLPSGRDTFRATDPAGNVYTPTGRLVSVATPPDNTKIPAGSFATAAENIATPGACGDGQVRCFSPVFYAVDTVVPLVSLGQRAAWYPNREAPWGEAMDVWLNLATILGWTLSTIFALSFTRLARSA